MRKNIVINYADRIRFGFHWTVCERSAGMLYEVLKRGLIGIEGIEE